MKNLLALFLIIFSISASNAQEAVADSTSGVEQRNDSLSEARKMFLEVLEYTVINQVDSIREEGMYMQALEAMETVMSHWKTATNQEPSPRMFMHKNQILMHLEEWQQLIQSTEECVSIHHDNIPSDIAAILYDTQGNAYHELKQYNNAVLSYEHALSHYIREGNVGSQGDVMCRMAYCYWKIGKLTTSSTYYEKGLEKFFDYFGTTRSALIKESFTCTDSYKKLMLDLFNSHLYFLAALEEENGNREAMKEYLKMSANCGNKNAQSEYNRLFGN